MSSVNSSETQRPNLKVSSLYKNLGISNNVALKPPLAKGNKTRVVKHSRRQTMIEAEIPESLNNFQRLNTCQMDPRKQSVSYTEEEISLLVQPIFPHLRNPKSRFINNWIQKLRDKENEKT